MPRTDRLTASGLARAGRPSIRDWAARDRPRERLRASGPRGLSSRELLSIVVGCGVHGASAIDLADALLREANGSIRRLGIVEPATLERIPGVGPATATRVLAALELGRRAATEVPRRRGNIQGPSDVFKRVGPMLRDLRHEEFHALLLNSQNDVIRDVLVTRGILDASLIHPREVFRVAIAEGAASVVLVHNHPSGDPSPSVEDRSVTQQLVEAGRAIGIPVVDHVIVGDGAYHSFSRAGQLGST